MILQPLSSFEIARTPQLVFGAGRIQEIGAIASRFGGSCLLVTGGESLEAHGNLDRIRDALAAVGITTADTSVTSEPSPDWVDETVALHRDQPPALVIAVGGGSVVDAGKAVAAMLCEPQPVTEYLEGVGTRTPTGKRLPFIAVPTTAGTGSEATKNAVLSRRADDGQSGLRGWKKSLRHDNYVPDVALIDPELTATCPPHVTAACGLDAFTQLLESFVSTRSTPFTDALAWHGMLRVGTFLRAAYGGAPTLERDRVSAHGEVAYGAYLSGITLANAGLGAVHGLAGPLGGLFPIPHGVACGALLAATTEVTVTQLQLSGERGVAALERYAAVSRILGGPDSGAPSAEHLVATLYALTADLDIAKLGAYGVTQGSIPDVVALASSKHNPVPLSNTQLDTVLKRCL